MVMERRDGEEWVAGTGRSRKQTCSGFRHGGAWLNFDDGDMDTIRFAELDRMRAAELGLDRVLSTGLLGSPLDVADQFRCMIPTASSLSVQGSIPSSFSAIATASGGLACQIPLGMT